MNTVRAKYEHTYLLIFNSRSSLHSGVHVLLTEFQDKSGHTQTKQSTSIDLNNVYWKRTYC